MPEFVADKQLFSLSEVSRSIQKTIAERYQSFYWIKAEMNKLNYYAHSGHCYPDLLEKKDGKVVAEMRATLWKTDYQRINQHFLDITKEPLKDGINILIQASIAYDPVHGLSLHIVDIDPSYSLGELEREKQASIIALKSQGIFDANKRLTFPLLPKRLAIISVETSKGLADFLKIIGHNPYGYRFEYTLFPALLQGDKAVNSIISMLHQIHQLSDRFDVVAIIRGGGGEVGLSAYNHLDLATAIARFPIPVLTGIGHATNETVSEMVAFKNAITPSELADFLIQHFHLFAHPVTRAIQVLKDKSKALLIDQQEKLSSHIKYFQFGSRHLLHHYQYEIHRHSSQLIHRGRLRLAQEWRELKQLEQDLPQQTSYSLLKLEDLLLSFTQRLSRENKYLSRYAHQQFQQLQQRLKSEIKVHLTNQYQQLSSQERQLSLLDPKAVLKRGYSITIQNGKVLTNTDHLQKGQTIKTLLAFGELESAITFVQQEKE